MIEFCSPDQRNILTRSLEDPVALLELVDDRNGTFVAQACLGHLHQPATLLTIVTSLHGKVGHLGCTQHGTFFLQRLVEVLGPGTEAAMLLHEDILANINILVISEVRKGLYK